MRLIDVDKLRDRLQSLAYDDWNQGVPTTWADAFSVCVNIVDDTSTVNAEPIRHGRWERIEPGDHYDFRCICSNCKSYEIDLDDKDDFKFCPNCGAKMEGAVEVKRGMSE